MTLKRIERSAEGDDAAPDPGRTSRRDVPPVERMIRRPGTDHETVVVWREMNDHGAMTVFVPGERSFRHVVGYDSPDVRATLRRLPASATLPVAMERIVSRGDCWRIADVG